MYTRTHKNEILNSLMKVYDTHNGKGLSSVRTAETISKLVGEDAGNALIRGFYGTRNRKQVAQDLAQSRIVQLAGGQAGRLNKEELIWSLKNPVKAWKIKQIGDKATKEAIEKYGTDPDVQTYGQGAEYRHKRRAQVTSKKFGHEVAEHITTIHETGNPHFNPNDPDSVAKKKMDMYNNKRGIELEKKYPKISDTEMRKKIREETEKGKSFKDFLPKIW